MKRLRLPGPGLVVAVIALVAALGGTSYATTAKTKTKTVVPKQSVGSAQIKDHSLLLKDFKPGQIPDGKKGDPGSKGEGGPAGPPGPTFGAAVGGMPPVLEDGLATNVIKELHVDVPVASRLMVYGQPGGAWAECPSALTCTIDLGVYVDGQPVPGGQFFNLDGGQRTPGVMPTIVGMTPKLTPGDHLVELRYVSRTGFSTFDSSTESLAAIGLGGG